MNKIVWCKAPHVHRHRSVVLYRNPVAFLVLVANRTVDTHYLCALYNGSKVSCIILRTDATGNGTILAKSIAHTEAYHCIFVC